MSMFNTGDILETIEMFTQENLDVRTVTMGISLLDCIDPDPAKACEKVYRKITTRAAKLVPTVDAIAAEYGIPRFPSSTSGSASPPSPCCWGPAPTPTRWTLPRPWMPPARRWGSTLWAATPLWSTRAFRPATSG